MKKNQRRIVFGLSLLTGATVLATTLATFSWLAANRNVAGGFAAVVIDTENISGTQMKSYSVTEILGNRYTFINNESDVLPRFDPSNIEYTEYEKALVFRVYFFCKEAKRYQIKAVTSESFHNAEEIASQNSDHLSNCTEFLIGQVTSELDVETFESAVVEVTSSQSFVSIDNNTVTKTNEIVIANVDATEGENVVYVVMQYNAPVIEYINHYRENNPVPITYNNDISFEFKEVA